MTKEEIEFTDKAVEQMDVSEFFGFVIRFDGMEWLRAKGLSDGCIEHLEEVCRFWLDRNPPHPEEAED